MTVLFPNQNPAPVELKPEFFKGDLLCMPAAYIPPTPTPGIPCNLDPNPTAGPIKPCNTPLVCWEKVCATRTPTP